MLTKKMEEALNKQINGFPLNSDYNEFEKAKVGFSLLAQLSVGQNNLGIIAHFFGNGY